MKKSTTLPTSKTKSSKETTPMTTSNQTANDIKKASNKPKSFSEQMKELELQAEAEEKEMADELDKTLAETAKGNDDVPVVITRPPLYGKIVSECLNYG